MVDGLIVSNGLAWTADGRTMFHSDSKGQIIWAYDYDPQTGVNLRPSGASPAPPNSRVARTAAATDEDGFYWSAGISAGVLNRWGPTAGWIGASRCRAPTRPRPVSAAPTCKTIFVTSLRHDLPADVLAAKPLSGGIFAVRVDVPGVPISRLPRLTPTTAQTRRNHDVERLHGRPRNDGHLALRGAAAA